MTYNDLAKIINGMTDQQKECNVPIFSRAQQTAWPVDRTYGYAIEYCKETQSMRPLIVINDRR